MKIIRDGLWLCEDCTIGACNGDFTSLETDERRRQVIAGLNALGPHLVPAFDSEAGTGTLDFSSVSCDACDSKLAGGRHQFVVLGK